MRRPNSHFALNQLQDLGGCRVILPAMEDVRKLVNCLNGRSRHEQYGQDDYNQTESRMVTEAIT